jgi:radical SAM-linked protein
LTGPRVTLVYPDTYELGASNFGLQVVRHLLLKTGEYTVRRGFHPAPDMYRLMLARNLPWLDIEAGECVADSSVVGFSVSSEILYTNVLSLLNLMQIELRSCNRKKSDPIILAGGGGLGNPVPLMPFVDVFFLGEAEAGLLPMMKILCSREDRDAKIAGVASLRGVLVPKHHSGQPVEWVTAKDLSMENAPVEQIVPIAQVAHDRAVVEIARGCTRGCRFCQVSQLSRPVRERSTGDTLELIRESVRCTGWEQAGVLALSFSDHSKLNELLSGFPVIEEEMHVGISQPSLRPDTLPGLANREFFKGSLTMAPEAGSERMRRIINKPLTDVEIREAAEAASRMGASGVKLYFMVGLPGETDEDILAIAALADTIAAIMGKKRKVTAALSPFVPKPHTPFQWMKQAGHEELWRKICLVRNNCRKASVSWNDPRVSVLEHFLCTGGTESQNTLERAFRDGAVFDGWSDLFRWDVWEKLLNETSWGTAGVEDDLPWDFVHTGVRRQWLKNEYLRSLSEEVLPDCRIAGCSDCGACDGSVLPIPDAVSFCRTSESRGVTLPVERVRVRYAKDGLARFTSHLDMVRMWTRALRRSPLPLYYSSGFARRLKLVFSQPLPLGMGSESEYVDFQLVEKVHIDVIREHLSDVLPDGFRIVALCKIYGRYRSPDFSATAAEYIIDGIDNTDKFMEYLKVSKQASSFTVEEGNKVRLISDLGNRANRADRVMEAAGVKWGSIVRSCIFTTDEKGRLVPLLSAAEGEMK